MFIGSIKELSDGQLYNELRMRGCNIGPVVASTRKVYEIRLQAILEDENKDVFIQEELVLHHRVTHDESMLDETESDDEFNYSKKYEKYTSPDYWKSRRQHLDTQGSKTSSAQKESQSAGSSVFLKIICTIIFVFIAYLIYCNIETPKQNPVPRVSKKTT